MQTCYFELINPAVFVLKNVNYYSEYSLANSPLLYWYWNKNRVLVKTNTILSAHFCFLPLILFSSSSFTFIEYLNTNILFILLSFIPAVNVTPLSRFVHCARLIITQRRGWGSFGGASVRVMAAFKTIYLSRHLHVKGPVYFDQTLFSSR